MSVINEFINNVNSNNFNSLHYLNEEEFVSNKTPAKPVYEYETTSKTKRIAVDIILGILSVLFLPYGIYRLVHLIGGLAIVPAQLKGKIAKSFGIDTETHSEFAKRVQSKMQQNNKQETGKSPLVLKRISVRVNGRLIDAMIVSRKDQINNKKWTLYSNPNATSYEAGFILNKCKQMIDDNDTNLLIYNYQGVGSSQGMATRNGIVNAHKAMLQFLEDETNGIGAKEITQIGVSIGGGVQGQAMKTHKLKQGVKYTLIKDDTFARISQVPNPFVGFLIKMFGWELSSVSSSIAMEKKGVPEIIIQVGEKNKPLKADDILSDRIIPKKGALAYRLLSLKNKWKHKKFIAHTGSHCSGLWGDEVVKFKKAMKTALDPNYKGFHPNLA